MRGVGRVDMTGEGRAGQGRCNGEGERSGEDR